MKEPEAVQNEWSYEEDRFIIEKMNLDNFKFKWTKISHHFNKKFYKGEVNKTDKQIKRRWLYVLQPLIDNEWNREQALRFVQISQKYQHSSGRYWNKLKNDFPTYNFKMLKCKYKQYKAMNEAKFILSHKSIQVKKLINVGQLDLTNVLCKHLECFV